MRPLVLSTDEATALGRRILDMTTVDDVVVWLAHTVRGVTRAANGRILGGNDGEQMIISIRARVGKRPAVVIRVDQHDEASLRAAVARVEALAREQDGETTNLEALPIGLQQYPTVTTWHDSTAEALEGARHEIIPQMLERVEQAGLEGAGFVGGIARTRGIFRKDGTVALGRETDMECTVTARTRDGNASGWAGQATRDWTTLDAIRIADQAIDITKRGANPIALEPGRRTVIFTPAALAYFTMAMGYAFMSMRVAERQSPFTKNVTTGGTKLGMRVFDARLQLVSDPTDPECGYLPFNPSGETGLPMNRMIWVDRGVLKTLSYPFGEALERGRQYHEPPEMLRIESVAGTPMPTLEEMIADCKEGILINHIANLQLLDGLTGMVTGTTRDGCFLVKNGKITRALKNFRFLDSPFFFLNNVEAIGKSERAAFGYVERRVDNWPLPPVAVPPMMVRDFNLNALIDAV